MTAEELAGLICATLDAAGITATLSGGTCVTIWSQGKYVSHDLDFIEAISVPRSRIRDALSALGFKAKGRHFVHADSVYVVEFPTGPLMVGDEPVKKVVERKTSCGVLRLLSPTDCVKDRLAAFYHWNDRQALEQALLVAQARRIKVSEVRRWSIAEGNKEKFLHFDRRRRAGKRARKPRGI